MLVQCIPDGLIQSNVYLVSENGEGVIIDCGCKAEKVMAIVEKQKLHIHHVILTHGHYDHVYYMDAIRKIAKLHVCIHEKDASYLSDSIKSGLAFFTADRAGIFTPADHLLKDGDILEAGALQFHIIHTPGHTPGGIGISVKNCVFTGDTLFQSSIGRTDLPGGSMEALAKSIQEKLYRLPDETIVYPGHGEKTTIGFEKRNNPYIRE